MLPWQRVGRLEEEVVTTAKRGGRTAGARSASGKKAVTSYDVARAAGVSQSAVSRALASGGSVSSTTREKVMRAVEELGYRPNAIARSLITNRSNMVAVVVANIDYHPELTAQISRSFSERGLHVLLFTMEQEADADRVVDEVWQYRVDGVIAAVELPRRHVHLLQKRRVPAVFINRYDDDPRVNTVCCDQVGGERLLVDGLIGAGHKRFGIIQGPSGSAAGARRIAGAVERLAECGIENVRFEDGDFSYQSGRRALLALLSQGVRLDAVICANDMMALGAMDAARHELGLAVPQALSIVGFDGLAQATWSSYGLVTVRQRTRDMVEAAVGMLIARVGSPALPVEKLVFPGELVDGGSARTADRRQLALGPQALERSRSGHGSTAVGEGSGR